jgi:hypothetical protein
MSTKQTYTDVTIADLRDIAAQIRFYADQYEAIATAMESRKLETIRVRGMDTLEEVTMKRLSGNISSINLGLAEAKSIANRVAKAESIVKATRAAEKPAKYKKEKES